MASYLLSVPEISCAHCKAAIEEGVGAVPGVRRVGVDVDRKVVAVDGEISEADVVAAIVDVGYEVAGPA